MYYVYSTLSAPVVYTFYQKKDDNNNYQPLSVVKNIKIRGGANITDKRLVTPLGIVTVLGDDDYVILQEHNVFKLHVKEGYVKVIKSKLDPDKVAGDMETRDISAPLVPEDSNEQALAKPKLGFVENDPSNTSTNKKKKKFN